MPDYPGGGQWTHTDLFELCHKHTHTHTYIIYIIHIIHIARYLHSVILRNLTLEFMISHVVIAH